MMIVKKLLLLGFLTLLVQFHSWGQNQDEVIQLSGFVLTQEGEDILPVPFVNIAVLNTSRGTYSNENGFFSLPVRKGELIIFSAIGFKTVEYSVPDTLEGDWHTIGQVLEVDSLNLPEIVVYPWPSRENFRVEFLAMEINDGLQERALANLQPYTMNEMLEYLPRSGREIAKVYFNNQAIQNYSAGQYRPMPIFNAVSWQKFIKAVKNGDFKNKKDK